MVEKLTLVLCLTGLGAASAQEAEPAVQGPPPLVYEVEFDDAVQKVSAEFVVSSLRKADEAGAVLFLVNADTPGGLSNAMDQMVDAFLVSPVPVVFYVRPTGAMAASAGYIIGLSADVFAACPGTSIGAATAMPLMGGGGSGEQKDAMDAAMKKANEIVAAQVRSMAEKRGRDPELAASAIFEAKAWSAEEALEAGLIDLIAADREELLGLLDGRTITRFDGSEVVLDLEGCEIRRLEMSARQRALSLLADPNVLYILFLVGVFGIMIEVYNPGLIVPGLTGVIALLLFAFGSQYLPVNVVGVILILLSVGFFIAEVKITSYGLLTAGGILCLILGGLMLIGDEAPDIPEMHVDPALVVAVSVSVGVIAVWGMLLTVKAHRAQVTTGQEGLIGRVGTAVSPLEPTGRIFVNGEYWDARSSGSGVIEKGSAVRVVASRGLELEVVPAAPGEDPLPGGSRAQGV